LTQLDKEPAQNVSLVYMNVWCRHRRGNATGYGGHQCMHATITFAAAALRQKLNSFLIRFFV
jgi:hypothetical protein